MKFFPLTWKINNELVDKIFYLKAFYHTNTLTSFAFFCWDMAPVLRVNASTFILLTFCTTCDASDRRWLAFASAVLMTCCADWRVAKAAWWMVTVLFCMVIISATISWIRFNSYWLVANAARYCVSSMFSTFERSVAARDKSDTASASFWADSAMVVLAEAIYSIQYKTKIEYSKQERSTWEKNRIIILTSSI